MNYIFQYNVPADYTLSGCTSIYLTVKAKNTAAGVLIRFAEVSAWQALEVKDWASVTRDCIALGEGRFNQLKQAA